MRREVRGLVLVCGPEVCAQRPLVSAHQRDAVAGGEAGLPREHRPHPVLLHQRLQHRAARVRPQAAQEHRVVADT